MKIHLKVWRQKNSDVPGKMEDYTLTGIIPELSFLEMLDILNEDLLKKGEEPVAFDHDNTYQRLLLNTPPYIPPFTLHSTFNHFLSILARAFCSIGLAKKSSIPAFIHFSMSSLAALAVMAIIGKWVAVCFSR